MSAQDYRINAEVRRHLVSRWVDIQQLQLGTTNGVVYVIGQLDTTMEDPRRRLEEGAGRQSAERVLRLALHLERELRGIRDVRDVIFRFDNVFKRGGRWRMVGEPESIQRPVMGRTGRVGGGGPGNEPGEDAPT